VRERWKAATAPVHLNSANKQGRLFHQLKPNSLTKGTFLDCYEIWFDLKEGARDLHFAESLARYMGYLQEAGLIEGYRLTRRKLGFGPQEIGEFHVTIETRDLAQLDSAFQRAASRDSAVEPLHAGVYALVKNAKFALYRDFPDPVREPR
jgi:hypothetical protein